MSAEQTNTKATKLMDAVSKGTFDNLDEREKSVAVALRVILGGNVESSDVLGVLPGLMRSMCALDSKCRESWLPSLVQGAEILEGMHNNDLMSVAHWFLGLATSHIDRPVSTFLTKLDVDELAEAKIDQVDTASKAATLRTAMGTTEDENTKTAAGNAAAYRRFLLGLGGYALEASRNGLPSDAARQAFRSAAVEALQTLGSGRGFRRSFVQNLITPQLALRAGVSPAYSGVRSAASIDLLAARFPLFYTNRLYVGGSASLADLLGPLSEMASRDEKVKFENEMLLLSLFFALRLEVNVGFPSLSEHLALSAGATMRLAAASEASENVARYEWIGEVEAGRCFEYGLSVKYLF